MALQKTERLADAGQHAQSQHVDFQHAEAFQVILVPFNDGAVLHGGILDGNER